MRSSVALVLVVCAVGSAFPFGGTSCTGDGGSGTCIDTTTSSCSDGLLVHNECPGGTNIVCCVTNWGSCTADGKHGTCEVTKKCKTTAVPNHCPGPTGVECCVSGAPSHEVYGPDVSSYQGTVDWAKVKASGVEFGICKATESTDYRDKYFAHNWKDIKSNGLVRGAYHFAHPNVSPTAQAQYFTSFVGPMEAGDFLVLDIEDAKGESPSAVANWCKDFLNEVCKLTHLPPSRVWVYTGAWFWNPQAGGSSIVSNHPLWVSGYSSSPPMPKGWSHWTMWQYTDKATIPGISGGCDASRFNSTLAELKRLVGA